MSEQVETPTEVTEEGAFGSGFAAALEEAFAAAGTPIVDPTKPDIVDPPVKVETVPDKVDKAETIPEKIEDVIEKDKPDITLPIDEPVEEVEEEPDTTGMTKAAGQRFKELRTEVSAAKKAVATAKQEAELAVARVKELEALSGTSEEVQKKLEAYELELSVSRLEATSAFKTAVTEPLSAISKAAAEIASKHSLDANKLINALAIEDQKEQDEALDDLLTGVNDRDKLKVYALAEKLPAIWEQEAKLRDNSSTVLQELEARKKVDDEHATVERANARKLATDLVAERVVKSLPFLSDTTKFALDAVKEKVLGADFDALDTTTKAYNSYAGHLLPQMAKALVTYSKEIEAITDELSKYKKASPSLKGGAESPNSPLDADLSFTDAIERALAGATN